MWYNINCDYLFRFVTRSNQEVVANSAAFRSISAYEDYHDEQKVLTEQMTYGAFNQSSRLEYMAHREGFEYNEISDMLKTIGISKSTDAVKRNYPRLKKRVIDKEDNLYLKKMQKLFVP